MVRSHSVDRHELQALSASDASPKHFRFLTIEERCELVERVEELRDCNFAAVEELLSGYNLTFHKYQEFKKGMMVHLSNPARSSVSQIQWDARSPQREQDTNQPPQVARTKTLQVPQNGNHTKVHAPSALSEQREQRRLRVLELKELDLLYIDNEDFHQDQNPTSEVMLSPMPEEDTKRTPRKKPAGLPTYLAELYTVNLLSHKQEVHLFRKMNYLKHLANEKIEGMFLSVPSKQELNELERHIDEAIEVEQLIVQSNLRLAVSVVRRLGIRDQHDFHNAVQNANMILMRAAKKFDYGRGYRFSTYATHAMQRDLWRRSQKQQKKRGTELQAPDEMMEEVCAGERLISVREQKRQEDQSEQLLQCIDDALATLDARSEKIVRDRAGLNESGTTITLRDIGLELGITKERVRQISVKAYDDLREILPVDIVEKLTIF